MKLEEMNVLQLKIALEEQIAHLEDRRDSILKRRYEKLSQKDISMLEELGNEQASLKSVLKTIGEFER